MDCIDGPIARINPINSSTDSGVISGRTMDALGSTIPTVGFLLGYSIFFIRNAFIESEKSGGFTRPNKNPLIRLCSHCARMCYKRKYDKVTLLKTINFIFQEFSLKLIH